jgi:hypothetical protein
VKNVDDQTFAQVSDIARVSCTSQGAPAGARRAERRSPRKSPFVSEATQPFWLTMLGTLERCSRPDGRDREILSESLNCTCRSLDIAQPHHEAYLTS